MEESKKVPLGTALDIVLKNHNKLKGSKEAELDNSLKYLLNYVESNPASVFGPICENVTKYNNKKKIIPYLDVCDFVHERLQTSFDAFVIETIRNFGQDDMSKRRVMGLCKIIRNLAITTSAKHIIKNLSEIISGFESDKPMIIEMEIFNTFIFLATYLNLSSELLYPPIELYIRWFEGSKQICSVAANELLKKLKDNVNCGQLISKLRTDVLPTSDMCKAVFARIAEKPFDDDSEWISLGLMMGRFDDERLRQEISKISTEQGQFSSVITVALSINKQSIQNIARAFFRFGIHGQEAANFDPTMLGNILESSDDIAGIALTFLSEMTIAHPDTCLSQMFPLLHSDKPIARKNAINLLDKVVNGCNEERVMKIIATYILPLVGDEDISVRVDIPKVFTKVPMSTVVPPLTRLLSDKSEKARSVASDSLKRILATTDKPEDLISILLDVSQGNMKQVPMNPGMINTENNTSNIESNGDSEHEKAIGRVVELVQKWSKEISLKIDPAPIAKRLFQDPGNGLIVKFITAINSLFDEDRLLSIVISKLKENNQGIYTSLAPLLLLSPMPVSFFTRRETMCSQLYELLKDFKTEVKSVKQLRLSLMARFSPSFTMAQVENDLDNKESLFMICVAGNIHHKPLPIVPPLLAEKIKEVDCLSDMFLPYADTLFSANPDLYLSLAIETDYKKKIFMYDVAFKHFEENDCIKFIRNGSLDKLLAVDFPDDLSAQAVFILFVFIHKCHRTSEIDPYWETAFDIVTYFHNSNNPKTRFNSLKLLGILLIFPNLEAHLIHTLGSVINILEIRSDISEVQEVRELASSMLKLALPNPGIEVVDTRDNQ